MGWVCWPSFSPSQCRVPCGIKERTPVACDRVPAELGQWPSWLQSWSGAQGTLFWSGQHLGPHPWSLSNKIQALFLEFTTSSFPSSEIWVQIALNGLAFKGKLLKQPAPNKGSSFVSDRSLETSLSYPLVSVTVGLGLPGPLEATGQLSSLCWSSFPGSPNFTASRRPLMPPREGAAQAHLQLGQSP